MDIQNHIPFSSYTPDPTPSSEEKQKADSPTTITTSSLSVSDDSSSEVSLEQVATDPIVKGILKRRSAYTSMQLSGKVRTANPGRSITFAENSTANNGELKATKSPSIKVVQPKNERGRLRSSSEASPTTKISSSPVSKSAPPAHLPDEYASDRSLEKGVVDAGRVIADGLSKAASAVAEFMRRPEDFFIPEQPKQKQSSTSTSSLIKKPGK